MASVNHSSMSEIEVCLDEAEHGACDALYNLGMMYSTGRGVSVDFVEAHKWFNLAAVKGNSDAQTWRKELAQEMTTTQIAEAQRQARAWLSTH